MANQKLSEWFGFSYSSFCVMPRVLMEDMPDEWQEKMAELLNQYNDAFDQSKIGVNGCLVQATDESGRLIKMPDEIKNYRRPCKVFLNMVRGK